MGWRMDFPKLHIAEDIRWCHQNKGIAIYLEHDAHSPINEISQYLGAKALWDTSVDSKQVLAEFYRLYYRAAAEPMRTFYETFYAVTREAIDDYDCFYAYPEALTPEVAATCRGHIETARDLAQKAVVKRRIAAVSRYWKATELHVAAQRGMTQWRADKNQVNREAARSAVKATMDYINSVAGEFYLTNRLGPLSAYLGDLDKG